MKLLSKLLYYIAAAAFVVYLFNLLKEAFAVSNFVSRTKEALKSYKPRTTKIDLGGGKMGAYKGIPKEVLEKYLEKYQKGYLGN